MPKRLIPRKALNDFRRITQQVMDDLSENLVVIQDKQRIFIDCPNCFEAGTLIETPFGMKPIESFDPGDFILDGNAETRIVDKVFCREADTEFSSIKTHGNNIGLDATSNHKLLVYENKGTPYAPVLGACAEKEIGSISKGDIVYKSIRQLPVEPMEKIWVDWKVNSYGPKKLLPEVIEVSDDFLFALGLYIAEGVTSKGRTSSYCLNDSEEEIGKKVCEYWKDIVDANYRMYTRGDSRNRVFEIYSSYLADLLDRWCGHRAENKKIPSSLYYRLNKRQTMVLLFGLFVGDGHYEEKYGSIVLGTVSKELSYQVYNLLLSCGYSASILSQPAKEGKDGVFRQSSFVVRYWSDENFIQRGTIRNDNAVYQVVKAVDKCKKKTSVWNLEVQTEHSYMASGFSVKNCIWDSINKKSSNVFDASFVTPVAIFSSTDQQRTISPFSFTSGRCPVCIGEGQLFTTKEVCIRAMINYISPLESRGADYVNLPAGREGTNRILVKTNPCHYELITQNDTFVVHNGIKCHKLVPAFMRGLGGIDAVLEFWLETSDTGDRTSNKLTDGSVGRDDDRRRSIKGPTDINIIRGRQKGQ